MEIISSGIVSSILAFDILSSEYKALFVMLRVQLLLYGFVQPKKVGSRS